MTDKEINSHLWFVKDYLKKAINRWDIDGKTWVNDALEELEKIDGARCRYHQTTEPEQSEFRQKVSALFMECNADINHSGTITEEHNLQIWRLLDDACKTLEAAEASERRVRNIKIELEATGC